jgi:membrane protein implicated in regulation of membrane protease activity
VIRPPSIFADWSRDQFVLILGPVLVSVVLVALYLGGFLPVPWPALLLVVILVNLAGDVAYAMTSERGVMQGRAGLCNDVVGQQVVVETGFSRGGASCQGTVLLGAERWRAVCDRPAASGDTLSVTARRGLTLFVS